MSKSVTIPMSDHPLRVCVNGVWYEYKAGATVTVPDEVAAVIEEYIGAVPKPAEEPGTNGQVWTRTTEGADWKDLPVTPKELPEVDEEDAGKVLTVSNDGKWVAAEASGGEEIVITFLRDSENTGDWSCDKTYAELVAIAEATAHEDRDPDRVTVFLSNDNDPPYYSRATGMVLKDTAEVFVNCDPCIWAMPGKFQIDTDSFVMDSEGAITHAYNYADVSFHA